MKLHFILLFSLWLGTVCGCSTMSPGRNLINQGNFSVDLAAGFNTQPLVSAGLRYGVTDQVNLNMNLIYPLAVSKDVFIVEPSVIVRLMRNDGWIPEINSYISLPTAIMWTEGEVKTVPALGFVPKYSWGSWSGYLALEGSFEAKDSGIDTKVNIKPGLQYSFSRTWQLGMEFGINSLGYANPLTPLGFPVILLGGSMNIGENK